MANSILTGGKNEWGGGINADCVFVTIKNGDDEFGLDGLLAQQVQAQATKQPRQVYEIGTQKHYIIDARPNGSGTIAHLIGPNTENVFTKLRGFSDVCTKTELTIGSYRGCNCLANGATGAGGAVTFIDGILNSIQLSATAQDYVITSNIGFMFFDVVSASVPKRPKTKKNENNNANAAPPLLETEPPAGTQV